MRTVKTRLVSSLRFKIYPYELGLLVVIAGLLVYAVKNREGLHQK